MFNFSYLFRIFICIVIVAISINANANQYIQQVQEAKTVAEAAQEAANKAKTTAEAAQNVAQEAKTYSVNLQNSVTKSSDNIKKKINDTDALNEISAVIDTCETNRNECKGALLKNSVVHKLKSIILQSLEATANANVAKKATQASVTAQEAAADAVQSATQASVTAQRIAVDAESAAQRAVDFAQIAAQSTVAADTATAQSTVADTQRVAEAVKRVAEAAQNTVIATQTAAKSTQIAAKNTAKSTADVVAAAQRISKVATTFFVNNSINDTGLIQNYLDNGVVALCANQMVEYGHKKEAELRCSLNGNFSDAQKFNNNNNNDNTCISWCKDSKNVDKKAILEELKSVLLEIVKDIDSSSDKTYLAAAFEFARDVYSKLTSADRAEFYLLQDINDEKDEQFKDGLFMYCPTGGVYSCVKQLEDKLASVSKQCASFKKEAQICCDSPEKCVGGETGNMLSSLGPLYVQISAMNSRRQQCSAVSQMKGLDSILKGNVMVQCKIKANKCIRNCSKGIYKITKIFKKFCGYSLETALDQTDSGYEREDTDTTNHKKSEKKIKQRSEAYVQNITYNSEKHNCDESVFNNFIKSFYTPKKAINLTEVHKKCLRAKQQPNRLVTSQIENIMQSVILARKNSFCKNGSNSYESTGDDTPFSIPDRTTLLRNGLPRPNLHIGTGGETEKDNHKWTSSLNSHLDIPANNLDDSIIGDTDEAQNNKSVSPAMGTVSSPGGGGSSGLGPGGSNSGTGGRKSTGGDMGRFDKKSIIRGIGSNKGFVGHSVGNNSLYNSSNKKSRSSRSRLRNNRKFSLNMKKFLNRTSKNSKTGKFGSVHDNIFKRITNRIKWMCSNKKISSCL